MFSCYGRTTGRSEGRKSEESVARLVLTPLPQQVPLTVADVSPPFKLSSPLLFVLFLGFLNSRACLN